jgi:hypothetical protein
MKALTYLLIAFFCLPFSIAAQKDSLKLSCPLNQAVEPPAEKQPYSLGIPDLKVVMKSASDTTVKACINGTITNVMRAEGGGWIVIFNHDDYYFLYSGITKVTVREGQKMQNGAAMGTLKTGEKLEFQMYDFETPLDPKKYLECLKSK